MALECVRLYSKFFLFIYFMSNMKNIIIIECHNSNAYWSWEIYGYRPNHTTLTWSKNE